MTDVAQQTMLREWIEKIAQEAAAGSNGLYLIGGFKGRDAVYEVTKDAARNVAGIFEELDFETATNLWIKSTIFGVYHTFRPAVLVARGVSEPHHHFHLTGMARNHMVIAELKSSSTMNMLQRLFARDSGVHDEDLYVLRGTYFTGLPVGVDDEEMVLWPSGALSRADAYEKLKTRRTARTQEPERIDP